MGFNSGFKGLKVLYNKHYSSVFRLSRLSHLQFESPDCLNRKSVIQWTHIKR